MRDFPACTETSRVKILHVIHSADPRGGGPIEGIRQLGHAMAGDGIATEVLSLDDPAAPWIGEFPFPLHATGPSRWGYGYNPRAIPWLRQNRKNFDAVILNGLWQFGSLAVWRALRGTPTPYYVYPHGMLDPWFKRQYPLKHLKKLPYWVAIEYRVLRDARAVLFTSEQERLDARESFSLYQCREEITGYGIAPPPGDGDAQAAAFLNHHPALKGRRIILFLGRVHEKKGCDLLLHAWKEFQTSGEAQKANACLVMAGPADHTYGLAMKELASRLGLDQSVLWTGMLANDLKWGSLRVADAFILPSHQENFGISVVEALGCGTPVLISDKINIWREIDMGNAGLIENDDMEGTLQLLRRWFSLDKPRRKEMSQQALACFETHFHVARTAKKLSAVLNLHSAT